MKANEVVESICEILNENCENPALELIKHGKVLQSIGSALKGFSLEEARTVLKCVADMNRIQKT
jgi:hypothetical protein